MSLQLKGGNNTDNSNVLDGIQQSSNPWDRPNSTQTEINYEEPKVIYNTILTEDSVQNQKGNLVGRAFVKMIMVFAICGLLFFVGTQVKSVILSETIDITTSLKKDAKTLQSELGESFGNAPVWATKVYEYSESEPAFEGTEDIGVIYMDGRQIGVHIASSQYMLYNVKIGDGEKHLHNNTTYTFDSYLRMMDTVDNKETLYIYYNVGQNDCIFVLINNVTNRIESMTYYNDYKKVTEQVTTF